jgi:hypothetical protein
MYFIYWNILYSMAECQQFFFFILFLVVTASLPLRATEQWAQLNTSHGTISTTHSLLDLSFFK